MIILRKIIKILFYAFIVWLVVRTFLFQTYRIPSASMHGTLYEGDYVVINKLAYGARLPITPLALPFGSEKKYVDWFHIPYWRLPGYSNINRGDVIAFNFSLTDELPIDMREEYIKRCIAIPGDTIQITNSKVYVNSELNEPASIYKNYTVISDREIDTLILKRLQILQNSYTTDKRVYNLYMGIAQADSLNKLPYIKSITQQPLAKDFYHPSVFPNSSSLPWNYDFFGPLYIPRKGDSLRLNKNNLTIYQRMIERFEKQTFSFKHDSAFINKEPILYYTFKQNYYFVIGDNRYNSTDSRNWGFIPESHIIGKAVFILSSKHSSNRTFLSIK